LRINVLKSRDPAHKNFSVKGGEGAEHPGRTAFQLVYRDGTVMVDSGMDLQVTNSRPRRRGAYFPEQARKWNGLCAAPGIVMTLSTATMSARHPFGVLAELAPKTV